MKKIVSLLCLVVVIAGLFAAYKIFGPTLSAPADKYFYIKTGSTYNDVKRELTDQKIIKNSFWFDKIASRAKYGNNVKPGKYEIKEATSIYSLVKMLKAGTQSPVRLVINKLRTIEDLAGKIGRNFECDSTTAINFLQSNDSLMIYKMDTNTIMSIIIPDTYEIKWNTGFTKILNRLKTEQEKFWTAERIQKAADKNLTKVQVYTLASIVDEETNLKEDKGKVASVYLNRMARGMKLEADPTLKFALKNFGLKRILNVHKEVISLYNTYKNAGLPPGPICTTTPFTLDAVLNAPATDYIFFVAQPNLSGASDFTSNYADHIVFAKRYQQWIGEYLKEKAAKNATP